MAFERRSGSSPGKTGQVVRFGVDQVVMGGGQVVGCRCIRDYLPRSVPAGLEGSVKRSFHPQSLSFGEAPPRAWELRAVR